MITVAALPNGSSAPDYGSVVCGDVSQPEWRGIPSVVSCWVNRSTSGGFAAAHLLNGAGNAAATGEISAVFTVPPGSSSVTLSAPIATVTGSSTVKLLIYAGSVVLASNVFTVTATETTCSLVVANGLSAGTLYSCAIQVNNTSQQAKVYVGRVQVKPGPGSGLFGSSSFVRIRVSAPMLGATSNTCNWNNGLYMTHSKMAEFHFTTDAQRYAVEYYSDRADIAVQGRVAHLVGGTALELSPPITDQTITIEERPVDVAAPNASLPLLTCRSTAYNLSNQGVFFRALYAPAMATTTIMSHQTAQRMVVVGDSIACSYNDAAGAFHSWPARLRTRYPGPVLLEAFGGRSLFQNAASAASQQAFAQALALTQPTDLWVALGVNDYISSSWSAASFGTAYAAWLDFLHALAPNGRVWCQSPIVKSVETANGTGSTLGDYRAQIQTAATAGSRSPWCVFVDGTGATFPQLTDLLDGIHPTTDGYGKYAQAVLATLTSAGVL